MNAAIFGRTMAAPDIRIGGLTPLTSIDFPGELAAVIFCQGCPWRCSYCHNPELRSAEGGEAWCWDRVWRFFQGRQGLLDGVVFSGGEPTLQQGLAEAAQRLKNLGFLIGLHSAGCYPSRLRRLLPLLDWVGLDLKAPAGDYDRVTQVPGSGARAWESARLLLASGVKHEIRVTVHPHLLTRAQVQDTLDQARRMGAKHLVVQACHPEHNPDTAGLPPVDLASLRSLAKDFPDLVVRE